MSGPDMSPPEFAGNLDAIAESVMMSAKGQAHWRPDWRSIEKRLWTLMIIARTKADALDAQTVDTICNHKEPDANV